MVMCDGDSDSMTVKNYRNLSIFYESFANNAKTADLEYFKNLLFRNGVIIASLSEFQHHTVKRWFISNLPKKGYQGLEKFFDCLLHNNHTGCSYDRFVQDLNKITKENPR